MQLDSLPIAAVLPDLLAVLASGRNAVVQAPPGAGKSTAVPLALLSAPWLQSKKIILLEPRRLAARALAQRMAQLLGDTVGGTVGYRMRMERKVSARTRIEVMTEGMLTRKMHSDPGLAEVGAILFDEFHERSVHADLGLTLSLEIQAHLRDDLRLVVMSATLDQNRLASILGNAECINASGRQYPVEVRYTPGASTRQVQASQVVDCIGSAIRSGPGDLLVFLPGVAEIVRVQTLLREKTWTVDTRVLCLYGDMPIAEQDQVLQPLREPGLRHIILATSIAETSLTIDGVRIVVDTGLTRRPRFDPATGMTRLETVRVSQAAAEQRRGRAGRLAPGICYRLWSETEQNRLQPYDMPEILQADLAPLTLDLVRWGCSDPTRLNWLDPPPKAAYDQALDLLEALEALSTARRITPMGEQMAALGVHPRIGHMLIRAKHSPAEVAPACALAALLTERDPIHAHVGRDPDITQRLELLSRPRDLPPDVDRAALQRLRRTALFFGQQLGFADLGDFPTPPPQVLGKLTAMAYPDRIAGKRKGGNDRYLLRNGRGAFLPPLSTLSGTDFLAVAHVDAREREAKIFLAAPLSRSDLASLFAGAMQIGQHIAWDRETAAVIARRETRLGRLLLDEAPLTDARQDNIAAAMLDGVRELGLSALPWTESAVTWRSRVAFVAQVFGSEPAFADWPSIDDTALVSTLESWLLPYLNGMTRREHLAKLDIASALRTLLPPSQQRQLDALAPTHLVVPSGSRIALDYSDASAPVLPVRIQELFGLGETPRIADNRVAVCLHLLSPAGRPVQVTRDLGRFWIDSYFIVRKELRGRYPKHPWPDDPLHAPATRRTKKAQP